MAYNTYLVCFFPVFSSSCHLLSCPLLFLFNPQNSSSFQLRFLSTPLPVLSYSCFLLFLSLLILPHLLLYSSFFPLLIRSISCSLSSCPLFRIHFLSTSFLSVPFPVRSISVPVWTWFLHFLSYTLPVYSISCLFLFTSYLSFSRLSFSACQYYSCYLCGFPLHPPPLPLLPAWSRIHERTYNFVEVSGHNLESSHNWGFSIVHITNQFQFCSGGGVKSGSRGDCAIHRLNMELDLLGSCVQLYSPPPPFGLIYEGAIVQLI